ncbi:MAG: hypothetical protein JJT96_15170 [Opitutales bacterium]|nr:hypothetical protein [Opitutales bacterium]
MKTLSPSPSMASRPPGLSHLIEPLTVIVEGRPSSGGMSLTTAIGYLDNQLRTRGESYPADLRHYLERRSYAKALAWVRNPGMRHTP